MATHTVTELHGEPSPWQHDSGKKFLSYWLSLKGVDERVNWNRAADADAPAVGESYDLDLQEKSNSNGKYYKATIAKKDGGGGSYSGGGGDSSRSIEAQVAMKEAGHLMVGFMGTGWKPGSVDDLSSTTIRLFAALNDALKDGAQ